jgi:hypothetical protein
MYIPKQNDIFHTLVSFLEYKVRSYTCVQLRTASIFFFFPFGELPISTLPSIRTATEVQYNNQV